MSAPQVVEASSGAHSSVRHCIPFSIYCSPYHVFSMRLGPTGRAELADDTAHCLTQQL